MTETQQLAQLYVLAREAVAILAAEIAPGATHRVQLAFADYGKADRMYGMLSRAEEIIISLGDNGDVIHERVENLDLESALSKLRANYEGGAVKRLEAKRAKLAALKAELEALESVK